MIELNAAMKLRISEKLRMSDRLELLHRLRKKLKNKQASIGSWIQSGSDNIAEIMADAGYDWLVIDMEHGSISISDLPNLVRAIELHACLPLVRIPEGNKFFCKNALDAGAAGVLIPDIRSPEHLKNIISWCCWPPIGQRGVGFSRANLYGKYFDDYMEEAQAPFIVAQIEHVDAIVNLEAILKVPGLDAIIIGPYDLSASMGIPGQFDNDEYYQAIYEYEKMIADSNIPFGIHIVHPEKELLQKKIGQRYLFIGYGTDALFLINASKIPEGLL